METLLVKQEPRAWDLPISVNPLLGREDLARSLDQIMEPLLGRFVRGNSGLLVGKSSAHYDEVAALFEGESRLLWGLAPLAAAGSAGTGAAADAIALVRDGMV